MAPARPTFHLRPGQLRPGQADDETGALRPSSPVPDPTLAQHLAVLVEDRASSADALVREASEVLIGWFQALPEGWSWRDARRVLDVDLAAFREAHAWRGTVAGWLHTLDVAVSSALDRDVRVPARELLAEELGLWLGGDSGDDRGELPWNGEPLVSGRRIPARESCAQPFLADLERGEVILVHGFSDTVARAIEQVAARGLAPEVVLTEGGPDLGGRRMARRLGPCGAKLRLIYDAALANAVTRSDRIWLGTEAIGAQALVLRVGSRTLLEEARRLEVPSVVFATSDKLVPGGQLELPAWSERDQWLLWESAPEGVRVDSQAFEFVPLDLCDVFATEHGAQNAAELSLRALRTH